ncbi:MAG: FUSC family protein [Acidimicrobiia bacterium]
MLGALWARLAARDPGRIALGRGLRAMIAGPTLFALGLEVLHNESIAVTAIFGAVSALVVADFGGSPRERIVAYGAVGVVGAGLLAAGTAVSPSTPASIALTLVVVAAVRFAGNLGPAFSAAVSPTVLALMLGLLVPEPDSAIPDRVLGWMIALAVAAALSIVVLGCRQSVQITDVAAAAADELASLLTMATDDTDRPTRDAAARRAAQVRVDLRKASLVPTRPSGPGVADVARRQTIERLTRLTSIIEASLAQPGVVLTEEMRTLGTAASTLLRAVARALRDGTAIGDVVTATAAIDEDRRRAFARLEQIATAGESAEALVDRIDGGFVARAAVFHTEILAAHVSFLLGGPDPISDPAADATAGTVGAGGVRRWRQFFGAYVNPTSVWFRDALRAAIALAIAVGLAQELALEHGFWVALGTLSVLRGTALATGQDSVRAASGTGVGFAISSLALSVVGVHDAWLWVLLVLFAFLLAYVPIVAGFVWGQACFTFFVVMLFNLLDPAGWHTGLVRVENVAIGVVVSTVVAAMFWPRRVEPLLADLLADTSTRAGELLVGAVHDGEDERWVDERRALVACEARTRAALIELMSQQRTRPAASAPWVARLGTATHTRSAADAIVRLHALVGGADPDPQCAAAMRDGAARCARAVAPGRGAPSPPLAPAVAETTRVAVIAAIERGGDDRRGLVRTLLTRDWIVSVARAVDGRP